MNFVDRGIIEDWDAEVTAEGEVDLSLIIPEGTKFVLLGISVNNGSGITMGVGITKQSDYGNNQIAMTIEAGESLQAQGIVAVTTERKIYVIYGAVQPDCVTLLAVQGWFI